jgi:hypothetical protein
MEKSDQETIARQKEAMKPRLVSDHSSEPVYLLLSDEPAAR